jgi:hypothetical protein
VIGANWVTAFRDAGLTVRLWDPNAVVAYAVSTTLAVGEAHAHAQGESLKACAAF